MPSLRCCGNGPGKDTTTRPRRWIKEKYFHAHEGRHWVFSGVVIGRDGVLETVRLFRAAQTAIKRHIKIRGEANPFDPAWEVYFEKRLGVKMESTLRGKGQCSLSGRARRSLPALPSENYALTGWHNHHKVWRSKGGGEQLDNRVLLHPTAINNFTAKGRPRWNRVLHRALERLELLEAKVSRAVLRGGDGGNTASLPDGWKRTLSNETIRKDF